MRGPEQELNRMRTHIDTPVVAGESVLEPKGERHRPCCPTVPLTGGICDHCVACCRRELTRSERTRSGGAYEKRERLRSASARISISFISCCSSVSSRNSSRRRSSASLLRGPGRSRPSAAKSRSSVNFG